MASNLHKNLTPFDATPGSEKVWWKCSKGDDHEWEAYIDNRIRKKSGCSVCVNRTVVNSNCLATTHPELAKEWHPTKNGSLTPYDIGAGSNKKVWWKCPKGDDHEWTALVTNRVHQKTNCSVCANVTVVNSYCLANTHPIIAKEWHPTKNGSLTPKDVPAGSHKKAWWKCSKNDDHEWNTYIHQRTRLNTKCPICYPGGFNRRK